jgi:hypothetical protein
MKKKFMIGALALLLVGFLATGAYAFKGGHYQESFESGDYDAYLEAHENNKPKGALSEEKFNEKVERLQGHAQNREKVKEALDLEDYDLWVEARGENCPFADKITEENFDTLVELHQTKNKMHELKEELGIDKVGRGMKKGLFKGRH